MRDNGLRYAVPASADDDDRRRLEQRPLWKHLIFRSGKGPLEPSSIAKTNHFVSRALTRARTASPRDASFVGRLLRTGPRAFG